MGYTEGGVICYHGNHKNYTIIKLLFLLCFLRRQVMQLHACVAMETVFTPVMLVVM